MMCNYSAISECLSVVRSSNRLRDGIDQVVCTTAWAAEEFASIDPENFYDFQATRPMVSLVDGYTRRIEWPENTFLHAPLPGGGRDAIILLGVEPNLRWRSFSAHVSGLAKDFGVELKFGNYR